MLSKISMRTLAVGTMILAVTFLSACAKKTMIGKDEVRYEGSATEQEAKALGAALKESGYFQDRGVSVILSKGTTRPTFRALRRWGARWRQPSAAFRLRYAL